MKPEAFRKVLRERLESRASEVLLHILPSKKAGAGGAVPLTGAQILRESERLAQLASASVGGVVLLLLPHSVELFLLHLGLILANRIPAVLPWPTSRVDEDKYERNLLHQFGHVPAAELITVPRLAANLSAVLPYAATACDVAGGEQEKALVHGSRPGQQLHDWKRVAACQDPGEAIFLQFSGGTTGSQKAVVITPAILVRQLDSLGAALKISREDAVVSWLPLYHDMGLIGALWLPLWHGVPSVQFAASDWLMNPGLLFELLERYHATACWLPNFAFAYLADQRGRMTGPRALGHVRGFINCSEPIRWRSMRRFAEAFADWGVRTQQLQTSYAMAENVFAVTQSALDQAPATLARAFVAEQSGRSAPPFETRDEVYVSSGAPLAGMDLRIVRTQPTTEGMLCHDREPGEIELRTETLYSGYWGAEGFVKSSFTTDGWYRTGDYGFLDGNELYVIGRLKDIVIVGGQNIFPEDVESVGNSVPGIYPGRVAAFGIDLNQDTETLVVVAEMRGAYESDRAAALEKEIARLVLAAVGMAPGQVRVVPERWIVKSTAGKISRTDTRARYLGERGVRVPRERQTVEAD